VAQLLTQRDIIWQIHAHIPGALVNAVFLLLHSPLSKVTAVIPRFHPGLNFVVSSVFFGQYHGITVHHGI